MNSNDASSACDVSGLATTRPGYSWTDSALGAGPSPEIGQRGGDVLLGDQVRKPSSSEIELTGYRCPDCFE